MYPNEPQTIAEVDEIIKKEQAVIIYFYSDDCAPCLSLRPKVVELVCDRFPKVKVVFINSKNHPMISANYGVFSMPTLILFFEGNEFSRKSKYVAIPELAAAIERPYKLLFEI